MRVETQRHRFIIAFLILAGLISCVSIRAGSDAYGSADFSAYRSFVWVDDSPLIQARSSQVDISPLNIRRIQDAIVRQLRAKGYTLADNRDAAEFSVSFTVGARDVIQATDYPSFYRGNWRWRAPYYWPNVDIAMYTEGTLAIDVFENSSRQPVWHGWARKRITGTDEENPGPVIDEAVAAIIEQFPARNSN